MKVILLQDVAKLGRRNTVVEVADGRGFNQLIPKGLALPATAENLKKVKEQKAQAGAAADASSAVFNEALALLKESVVVVKANANEQGHLFQAIKEEMVIEAAKAAGATLAVGQVSFEKPIKEVGKQQISLSQGGRVEKIEIEIVAN